MRRWRMLVDRYWHWRYWRAVRRHGTGCEHVTDLAERCIDSRLAVRKSA